MTIFIHSLAHVRLSSNDRQRLQTTHTHARIRRCVVVFIILFSLFFFAHKSLGPTLLSPPSSLLFPPPFALFSSYIGFETRNNEKTLCVRYAYMYMLSDFFKNPLVTITLLLVNSPLSGTAWSPQAMEVAKRLKAST